MRIFLIGYMGSGKTSFGKKLAKRLQIPFVDLDEQIESQNKASINTIFKEKGEKSFRELERQMLSSVVKNENGVISVGGGTPCYFDNMQRMNQEGITIYLELSPNALYSRLINSKEKRPIIKDKSPDELRTFIEVHLKERSPYYKKARITINGLSISAQQMDILLSQINSVLP